MNVRISFRVDKKQRDKLKRRANALGVSMSQLLREMVDRELQPRRLGDLIGHLAGRWGPATRPPDEWEKHLRKQNWRE
jgi:hypothetical protein